MDLTAFRETDLSGVASSSRRNFAGLDSRMMPVATPSEYFRTPMDLNQQLNRRQQSTSLYDLYWVFLQWQEATFGDQEPPGLLVRPLRSADTEWPNGALLPAIICLLRSRLARVERLRSMRRWHMLYTSHATMVPCTQSHLSCLAKARRSHDEYEFYCELASGMLLAATGELQRARRKHGMRTWIEAVALLNSRSKFGPLSPANRNFGSWSLLASENRRAADAALAKAEAWRASGGNRMPRVNVLRRWRVVAADSRRLLGAARGVALFSARRAVLQWHRWLSQLRTRRASTGRRLQEADQSHRDAAPRSALGKWGRRTDAARLLRMAALRPTPTARRKLCRSCWIWIVRCGVALPSANILDNCSLAAQVAGQLALRRWSAHAAQRELRLRRLARVRAAEAQGFSARTSRALERGLDRWLAYAARRSKTNVQMRKALSKTYRRLACHAGVRRWVGYVHATAHVVKVARLIQGRRYSYAWRSWRLHTWQRISVKRACERLRDKSKTARQRGVHGTLVWALGRFRAQVERRKHGKARRNSARRAVLRMARRENARAFRSLADEATARREARELMSLASRARFRWVGRAAWMSWRETLSSKQQSANLLASAVFAADRVGARRCLAKGMDDWFEATRWTLFKAAAARRWMSPSLAFALNRMIEAYHKRQLIDASYRVFARRRQGALLAIWRGRAVSRGYTRAIMAHGELKCRIDGLQWGLIEWRASSASLARRTAKTHEHERKLRLGAAAGKVFSVLKRNALHAWRQKAADRMHNSKRVVTLGRLIGRIDRYRTFDGWKGYALWDATLLAKAADAFPGLHRRSHLLHWHHIAMESIRVKQQCTRALGRLAHRHEARAWNGWALLARKAGSVRAIMRGLLVRWRSREINRALCTWESQAARRREALTMLNRSFGSWRSGHRGKAWRRWVEVVDEIRRVRGLLSSATYRIAHRGVARGFGKWAEFTSQRLRSQALMTRVMPTGRQLLRAMTTWLDVYQARLRTVHAVGEAFAHRDGRLMRRVFSAWGSLALAAEARRKGLSTTMLSLHGAARGMRTWRLFAEDRGRHYDIARHVGRYGFLRELTRAFLCLRDGTVYQTLRRTAAIKWLSAARTFAFAAWRDEVARVSLALANARRAVGFLRNLKIGPSWRTWVGNVDFEEKHERMQRRAFGHWANSGYAWAFDKWARKARDALDVQEGVAELSAMRRAVRRLVKYKAACRSIEDAWQKWVDAKRRACFLAWQEHADELHANAKLDGRAIRHWRRLALADALHACVDDAQRQQTRLSLECKADDHRMLLAFVHWADGAWAKALMRDEQKDLVRAVLTVWHDNAAAPPDVDDEYYSDDAATGHSRGGRALSAGVAQSTSVVVFGAGTFGQLGCGHERPQLASPTRLRGLSRLSVRAAACGDYHSAILTSAGEIFTFGIGEFGCLGHGDETPFNRPRRVEALLGEHAVSAACGWRHTLCLTASGRLYSWGHGGFGQLGHGGQISFFLPLQIQSATAPPPPSPPAMHRHTANGNGGNGGNNGNGALKQRTTAVATVGGWQQVSCGWRHSAALADGGIAYTWGDSEHRQLGHGDKRTQTRPKRIEALQGETLRQLECGSHHCAAIDSQGRVYTWGSGSFGQLGHGERRSEGVPRLVGGLASIEAVRVACGGHTCVLSSHGELYTFGNGKHGQLGHGEQHAGPTPRRVGGLRHVKVLGIACGDFHTLALADDGAVYTWGTGSFGELGHGDQHHYTEPKRLEGIKRHSLVFAACGASHNVLLVAPSRAELLETHPADAGLYYDEEDEEEDDDEDVESDDASVSSMDASSAGESAATAATRIGYGVGQRWNGY